MYEQTIDDQNGSDASNNGQTTFVDYRGRGDSTQSHRPEDDAVIMTDGGTVPAYTDPDAAANWAAGDTVFGMCPDPAERGEGIMTDGGEAGCPHGHPYCEGAGSPAEKPELCFECWDEWAAYEPELVDESEQWDPETDDRPRGKADYDAGSDSGIVEDTCAIPNCDDEPIEGERMGLCAEHAADDAVDRGEGVETDGGDDYVTCDSCGKDVLVMVELRGEDAVDADALCAECLDDSDDAVDRGEGVETDGGEQSVEFTAPGKSIGTEVEPGTVIELPHNGGMWTVYSVKEPAVTRITEYHVEPVTGGECQVWKEYELENAFDAGASIIAGGA